MNSSLIIGKISLYLYSQTEKIMNSITGRGWRV